MKFFEQQDHARRQTGKLIALFVPAVLAIVAVANMAMALLWSAWRGHDEGLSVYPPYFFLFATLVPLGLIVGGTSFAFFGLRGGGAAVARMAGGRLLDTDTRDPHERCLIDVVEEMALASGIACPRIHVIDGEPSINAFAAGHGLNEAALVVTRGALERLSHNELQGVVAHEFSQILGGDMCLNMRLIGMLSGIQMAAEAGRKMMALGTSDAMPAGTGRYGSRHGATFRVFAVTVGALLFAIGYIGLFFARLIKSAVVRQRAFLADASAVQFIRNPDGLGNALRKMGGLMEEGGAAARIAHGSAERLSHLYLNAVRPGLLSGLCATHPSLQDRLYRIYGRDRSWLEAPPAAPSAAEPSAPAPELPFAIDGGQDDQEPAPPREGADIAAAAPSQGDGPLRQIRLAEDIDRAVHDPHAAVALVLALFMESGAMSPGARRDFLQRHLPQQSETVLSMAAAIRKLPHNARLPLLELSVPALRRLPVTAHMAMLDHVERLVAEDRRVTLQEYILQMVLLHRLDTRAVRTAPVRFHDLSELRAECIGLFSLAAHVVAPCEKISPPAVFLRLAAACPQLALGGGDLQSPATLRRTEITRMLERIDQLAPMRKPMLIRALLTAADPAQPLPLALADLLRAICVVLDMPMPAALASVYIASGWPQE